MGLFDVTVYYTLAFKRGISSKSIFFPYVNVYGMSHDVVIRYDNHIILMTL